MIQDTLNCIKADQANALDRLCQILRIPSVSTDPEFAPHCRTAAQWMADQLTECGLTATIHETGGHPAVVAQYNDAPNHPETGAPATRVLFYGHYDVQPPDPLELWTTPPFEPTLRDGKIFARGASDDKGQVLCFIEALRGWKNTAGAPPINITVLIEGEEECGSENLDNFIENNTDLLAADIALVSDTAMWGPEIGRAHV